MKTKLKLLVCLFCTPLLFAVCASQPSAPALNSGGTLVWKDEFEGDSLDPAKWNIDIGTGAQHGLDGWGNQERQFYKPENVIVKNGHLYLEARMDNDEVNNKKGAFPYTSGKISTGATLNPYDGSVLGQKFAVLPGMRLEARIKSPRGVGLWPAFWLIGATSNSLAGNKQLGWPRCGEIDILEIRGGTENRLNSTIHYGPYWPENRAEGDYKEFDFNLADDWHVYGVTWDKDVLNFLFDGEVWHTIDLKQLNKDDKKYYISEAYGAKTGFIININLAVGGQYISNKIPDDAVFDEDAPYEDRCFMIDWVRVYQ